VKGQIPDSASRHPTDSSIVNGPRLIRERTTGALTTVIERRARTVAGARTPAFLLLSTERGFTRLWNYPSNWMALSDEALLALPEQLRRLRSA
jgi:hypothetical protein